MQPQPYVVLVYLRHFCLSVAVVGQSYLSSRRALTVLVASGYKGLVVIYVRHSQFLWVLMDICCQSKVHDAIHTTEQVSLALTV
jgi:hypothetical protein